MQRAPEHWRSDQFRLRNVRRRAGERASAEANRLTPFVFSPKTSIGRQFINIIVLESFLNQAPLRTYAARRTQCMESNMEFDTKVAVIVLEDLAIWQKLNVTAFLATGIAGAAPHALGAPYEDASGRTHARLLGQPMMIYKANASGLLRAYRQSIERELTRAVYVRAMFFTGHDEANREAFRREPPDAPDLVGLAIRGVKNGVDKAIKGLSLHP